jgi:hypothetical protein
MMTGGEALADNKTTAALLDDLAALHPAQRREVAAGRDTATSPPPTPGH